MQRTLLHAYLQTPGMKTRAVLPSSPYFPVADVRAPLNCHRSAAEGCFRETNSSPMALLGLNSFYAWVWTSVALVKPYFKKGNSSRDTETEL
ncbi:hypothetical protein JZ751_003659 [Albula glossodonta]|uniref:Uncharacterized protein n=1 Tax=Albula glossodonta TaxID=121402 RepID=A0A8T2NHB4_9TELE|nr:hypothetical protein JZ751_003659 [Albula glossodonta]